MTTRGPPRSSGVTTHSARPSWSMSPAVTNPPNTKVGSPNGSVGFTSSDGQATLPPPYTFAAADAGAHAFSGLTLRTAGAQTVYDGLYVLDASIIPGAVAVNPTLSIVSMAARAAKSIA